MPRFAISSEQRRAIRRYHQNTRPKPRQVDIANWFEQQYNHRLRQSTISESLSDRFAFLDSSDITTHETFRKRPSQWPILEAILFEWHQIIERQGISPSGDILLDKAKEIWPKIPQYEGQPIPHFSAGWLQKFKARYNLRRIIRHGEAASVPPEAEVEMRSIQTLCGDYEEEDIYNMDETGLFWRQSPSGGLSTQQRPGIKKDKSRISIICCTNYTGSRKFPLWIIGNAKQPRSLRNVNLKALGIEWRSNRKAWMETLLMADWLRAFYRWIGHRSIILLMDNLSAHKAGVEIAPPPSNIRIQWLPKNSTSRYQPLDQGIIQNLKSHYKRRWLQFMVQNYEAGNNPLVLMSLFNAVRWISQSWDDVTASTIYRCFRKAKIQPYQEPIDLPADPAVDINTVYERVRTLGQIQEMMSLQQFLNPIDENLQPQGTEMETDLDDIIARHATIQVEDEREEDEAEIEVQIAIPSTHDALQAVQLLQRYQECQEFSTQQDIQQLRRIEREIQAFAASKQQQGHLDSWIM